MKLAAFALLVALLVVFASAHPPKDHFRHHKPNGHHDGKHGHHGNHHTCSYKSSKGHHYDFGRLASRDLIVRDLVGGSSYHFNPCGAVHISECNGAAVCELTNKGEAIAYGQAKDAHWADGGESGASVEVSYGGGELCSEGVHRKAVVEMRCLVSTNPAHSPGVLMGVVKEECMLKLIVESPLACDRETMCGAISSEENCNANSDLCEWREGVCVASSGNAQWRKHVAVFALSAVVGFAAVICLCCSVVCACLACRRAARRRKLRVLPVHKKAQKSKKSAKGEEELNLITPETSEPVVLPDAHIPFQPFVMHQGPDGSFVPVPIYMPAQQPPHSYSYPMAQFIPAFQQPPQPAQE